MIITFLGTGTSNGVPVINCTCDVCRSIDLRDKRLRCSAVVETDDLTLLLDCSPDFRQQALSKSIGRLDGVLLTHHHFDHTAGLDELRPYTDIAGVPIYANAFTLQALKDRMPYAFLDTHYKGLPYFHPHAVESSFTIHNTTIVPIHVNHGNIPILGYRIGSFAYLTDVSSIDASEIEKLRGVDLLVINALRPYFHPTHFTLDDALNLAKEVAPLRTQLTHMSHDMGLHDIVNQSLPDNVQLAYDNLVIHL